MFDMDGDGITTRDEIVQYETIRLKRVAQEKGQPEPAPSDVQKSVDFLTGSVMQADLNGDGRIEWPEMIARAKQLMVNFKTPLDEELRVALSLSSTGLGPINIQDLQGAAERVFHSADADGDGTVSKEEFEAFARGIRVTK